MKNERIDFAFLDSGTGGIPYMKELKKKAPDSRCVYMGDTEHFPYGEKSYKEVVECSSKAVSLILQKWSPQTIVIACNTISVTALDELRNRFPNVPIVGTVPAIKLAAKVTVNKNIGLLATNATVNHPYCERLIKDFASDCNVVSRGDPSLIEFIEHKLFTATAEEKINAVMPAVNFFKENKCDTIILGCTHFCHMAEEISFAAGKDVRVVDSRDGVAKQALRVEEKAFDVNENLSCHVSEMPEDESFFVTALDTKKNATEYETLCKNFNIPWGGVIC